MDIAELRSSLHALIEKADAKMLQALWNILERKTDLPVDSELLTELLAQSKGEYASGEILDHDSVMKEVRAKYGLEE